VSTTLRRLRRARRAFFGTRSRITAFLLAAADRKITDRYRGARWLTTVILLLLLLQLFTGVLLALYYYPEPDAAYESTRFLMGQAFAGWLVRGVHVWSGELLLAAVLSHLAVVYFRRAYARPREYEWVLGLLLLLAMLGFRFTGRLLPWDAFGYESARHGLELIETVPVVGGLAAGWLRAGEDMGPNTLSRFFATHVLILPWVVAGLTALHLVLVRRHGLQEDEA
jgi:quinol---cytochrome c reductase cytochrome b subunit, bacillus type